MANQLTQQKIATTLSFVLSLYGNIRYLVGRSPYDKHSGFHVDNTPFTSNILVVLGFWAFLYLIQAAFIIQTFYPTEDGPNASGNIRRSEVSSKVAWHFTLFNVLSFAWSLLFARKHWFLSEVIAIINFFNIVLLNFNHKTYSIKPFTDWVLIHVAVTAFPLSWLLYVIFWNGAVLFHVHHLLGRILANVLIWDFLVVPGFFLVIYNDYAIGISSSILTFGLGLGQLFTKVIALQWIFAFVISGLLLVLSIVAASRGEIISNRTDEEAAPLLN